MSNRDIENSEKQIALLQDVAVRRANMAVAETGCDDCIDCGYRISGARRQAAPFAQRCIACQNASEREARCYA